MQFILTEIKKQPDGLQFDEQLDIKDILLSRNPEVLDVSAVTVSGTVSYDDGLYLLSYTLDYVVSLPSSRSMKPVSVPLTDTVNEVFVASSDLAEKADVLRDNLALPLESDVIDLDESVVDNILLSLPMKVLAEDEMTDDNLPSGDNWSVMTESQYEALQNEKKQANNPFNALDGLFDED